MTCNQKRCAYYGEEFLCNCSAEESEPGYMEKCEDDNYSGFDPVQAEEL